MSEKILLKKYTNRRLYDTEQSKYVTLSEVAELIRADQQGEVVDAKTKEDVTAFILTQATQKGFVHINPFQSFFEKFSKSPKSTGDEKKP